MPKDLKIPHLLQELKSNFSGTYGQIEIKEQHATVVCNDEKTYLQALKAKTILLQKTWVRSFLYLQTNSTVLDTKDRRQKCSRMQSRFSTKAKVTISI